MNTRLRQPTAPPTTLSASHRAFVCLSVGCNFVAAAGWVPTQLANDTQALATTWVLVTLAIMLVGRAVALLFREAARLDTENADDAQG